MKFVKKKFSDQYYLESAPIKKTIAHLSIPMMIGMSVGTVYNVINAYFIGLLNNTEMFSAITLGLPIFTILMAIGNVFGVGGGTFISRLIGERYTDKAKNIAGYTLYGSVFVGVAMAFLAIVCINPITHLLGADVKTFGYAKAYAMKLFGGGFAIVVNFALEQLVRSEGASKVSMIGIVLSAIASLILDPILILVLKWNVAGAALSMTLANLVSSCYYIYFLEKKSANLRGFVNRFRLSLVDQLEIYKIGLSELFQSVFLIVSTLLLNHYAIQYGDGVVASFGVALRIVQVPEFLSMGLFLGLMPFFAVNFGSKNFTRFKEGFKQACIWIGTISVVFVGIVFLFKESIFKLFSSDTSLLSIGITILGAMLISALFNGFTGLFTGLFQATGQGFPTNLMAVTQGILFIPVIIFLHYYFGLHGVIWSMTITEMITCLMGVILFGIFRSRIYKIA